jgi:O-antigen ligase
MAHNGYIEIYINLGIAGLIIWLFLILSAYNKGVSLIRINWPEGAFKISFIVAIIFYNITEYGFSLNSFFGFLFFSLFTSYNHKPISVT